MKKKKYRGTNMKKKKKVDSYQLDQEEQDLLSSFENDEWKSVKNLKKEKLSAKTTASKTLRKDVIVQ
jgi:predicted DNA binding CopG/RHH family protein